MITLENVLRDLRSKEWFYYWNKPFVWLGFLGVVISILAFSLDGFLSKILGLLGGVLIGLFINYITNVFGSENDGWLNTAESCCKQILKAIVDIDDYTNKEQSEESFCRIAENVLEDDTHVLLVKKHCEFVDSKLNSLRGDLFCIFSDWQNFINSNCREGECSTSYIWERVYSVAPAKYYGNIDLDQKPDYL